jgi:hypothetical protein
MDALTGTQIYTEICRWPCKIAVIGGAIRDVAIALTAFYAIRFLKTKTQ